MNRLTNFINDRLNRDFTDESLVEHYKCCSIGLLEDSDFDVFLYDSLNIIFKVKGLQILENRVTGLMCSSVNGSTFFCYNNYYSKSMNPTMGSLKELKCTVVVKDSICDLESYDSVSTDCSIINSIIGKFDYILNKCNEEDLYNFNEGTFSIYEDSNESQVILNNYDKIVLNIPYDFIDNN